MNVGDLPPPCLAFPRSGMGEGRSGAGIKRCDQNDFLEKPRPKRKTPPFWKFPAGAGRRAGREAKGDKSPRWKQRRELAWSGAWSWSWSWSWSVGLGLSWSGVGRSVEVWARVRVGSLELAVGGESGRREGDAGWRRSTACCVAQACAFVWGEPERARRRLGKARAQPRLR